MALTKRQLADLAASSVSPSGNRLPAALGLAGMTQMALADAIGLSNTYISDTARGRHQTITLDNAHKFAAFFGAPIEVLFPARDTEAA